MAMLDAILMPVCHYRYYSFDAHWGQGEMMGSMINGSGDEFFALFNKHGVFLKGFDHEATAARIPSRHFYRELPAVFEPCAREPAFSPDYVTFCVWRQMDQAQWSRSRVALFAGVCDGSADILSMLDGVPSTYRAWAIRYYGRDVPLRAIESVYQHQSLTEELVLTLNPEQSLERLHADTVKIGYAIG